MSYQYKMDYICSFTMAVLLRENIRADTMETICFYSNPELLFDAFGCKTQEDRDEILNMMITMDILQSQPAAFYRVYTEATGNDPAQSDEAMNEFRYSLKPSVCITLSRIFYRNLAAYLQENTLQENDLFFLLNLFEGHLNQHLRYSSEETKQINEPFFTAYTAMRSSLFQALEMDRPEKNLAENYAAYVIMNEDGTLNTSAAFVPQEKQSFLAERAQWQQELHGLGVKVAGEAASGE